MEINALTELGANLISNMKSAPNVSANSDNSFMRDLQRASEVTAKKSGSKLADNKNDSRAEKRDAARNGSKNDVRNAGKANNSEKTQTGGELSEADEVSADQLADTEAMAIAAAQFLPILQQNIIIADETVDESQICAQQLESMPVDNEVNINDAIMDAVTDNVREATDAEQDGALSDTEFAMQALGEIQQAVASNEAERTVSAQTQTNLEQEAGEGVRISEYDKHIDDNGASEDVEESVAAEKSAKSEKSIKTEKHEKSSSKPVEVTEHANAHLRNEAPPAEVAFKDGEVAPREAQQAFFDSVLEQVQTAVNDEQSELFIKLKPDVLGGLSIRLIMTNEGLSAQVKTSNEQLRTIVNAEIAQLEASLKDKGIDVVNMDVIYEQSAGNQYLDQQQQRHWNDSGSSNKGGGNNAVRVIEETAGMHPLEQIYESMSTPDSDMNSGVEYSA